MRAVLLCAVLAVGCSKKSETKNEPAPAKPEPAAEVPKPDKPVARQPVAPAAAAAEAPKVDCDPIVTAADIEKHCKVKVEVRPTQYEGKMGQLGVCNRVMSKPGEKWPIAYWKLAVLGSPQAAENHVKLDRSEGSKDLAGLGDAAWTSVEEHKKLDHLNTAVGVRKGAAILSLHHTKSSMNENPPCTLEQLVEVAREAVTRLP